MVEMSSIGASGHNRVLAIVVTYNPDLSVLKANLKVLVTQKDTVYISDNGSKNIKAIHSLIQDEFLKNNVYVKHFNDNVGIATAQNAGLKYAVKNAFEYICFFDQDTLIPKLFLRNMVNEFLIAKKLHPDIGMLAPNFYDYRLKEYTHFARLTLRNYVDVTSTPNEYTEVSFVVSSGSLIPVSVIEDAGLLIDEFFIDQVDTEYSLRLLKHDYKIIVTPNVVLKHTIGKRTEHKLLGLTIKPNHHSALRKYFIFRNGRYVVRQYKSSFPGIRVLMFKRFVHDILGVVFFENEKLKKLRAIIKGYRDGAKPKESWKVSNI